jgi:very-short-patch-repair endonuclease
MKGCDGEAVPPVLARDRARTLRAAQTEVERRVWQRLRNRQLKGAKIRRQHPIGPCIVDFLCLDARLVIELDGSQHGDECGRQYDEHRTGYLESHGYRVVRFWNEEILHNIDDALETIARHL